ncbi:MAG: hypothetical protein E4H18_04275 [Hyphomicrobiales bacterium]|nr:MAG: hypothetical protein E4H18_04275 [Hyphomicrobiales bacterium]
MEDEFLPSHGLFAQPVIEAKLGPALEQLRLARGQARLHREVGLGQEQGRAPVAAGLDLDGFRLWRRHGLDRRWLRRSRLPGRRGRSLRPGLRLDGRFGPGLGLGLGLELGLGRRLRFGLGRRCYRLGLGLGLGRDLDRLLSRRGFRGRLARGLGRRGFGRGLCRLGLG